MSKLQAVLLVSVFLPVHLMDVFAGSMRPTAVRSVDGDADSNLVKTIWGGRIKGKVITTPKGNSAQCYVGVPYAAPPLGSLRFADPVKPSWSGTRQTVSYGPACWLNSTTSSYTPDLMSEDCLYLNMYVPANTDGQKLPVLYYIHGGGNEYDSPRMFPAEPIVDNLVSRGVIVILPGYRLGIAGFFSTGTKEFTGNYGYKDIVHGLKWVKENIGSFGGDPDKVTVMGHSSGASTVAHLSIIPSATPYFSRGVEMSGNGAGGMMISNDLSRYKTTAQKLNCSGWDQGNYQQVGDCLRTVDIASLSNTYLFETVRNGIGRTAARIDGPGGLFPEPLETLLATRAPITTMLGTTKHEVPLLGRSAPPPNDATVGVFCDMICASNNFTKSAQSCRRFYLEDLNQKLDANSVGSLKKDILADSFFNLATLSEATSLRARGADVFLYSFDYVKKDLAEYFPFHTVDLTYIFGLHPFKFNDEDIKIQEKLLDLYENFMKSGNPTPAENPKWEALRTPTGFNYYSIDLEPKNEEFFHFLPLQFWNTIVPYVERFGKTASSASLEQILPKLKNLALAPNVPDWAMPAILPISNLIRIEVPATANDERPHVSPFTIIGWIVLAVIMYGLVAATVSYVACGKWRPPNDDTTPLLVEQRSYSAI